MKKHYEKEEIMKTETEMQVRRTVCAVLSLLLVISLLGGCGARADAPGLYRITVEGAAEESGVIEFAGLTMNVYPDAASNPCGDCPDQPVSVYVGTDAAAVAGAMANVVEEANDLWDVSDVSGGVLELREKVSGSVMEEPVLEGPKGLVLKGAFYPAGSAQPAESGKKGADRDAADTADKAGWKTIENIDGSEMRVPAEEPERISAVYGPAYEALVVLGAEDRIVSCADVQFENFPWARKIFRRISSLPYLKNVHSSVSAEQLKTWDPQLVLTFNRPNELRQMNALEIAAVYGVTSRSLDDVKDPLRVYAEAVGGEAPARAESYAEYFDGKLASVREVTDAIPEEERPLVYYSGIDILTTYGAQSDMTEVIEAAGGKSATADLNAGNHAQINFEQLASWDPEYIFIDHGAMNERQSVEDIFAGVAKNHKYQAIRAVRQEQVYLTPSGVFYWDMGLQKILLVMYMAKILHPEKFADLDMEQELMEFYGKFYGYDLSRDEATAILNREDPS